VGTGNYLETGIAGDIAAGIEAYAARHGYQRVSELVGRLEHPRR
jgi:dihydroorotate dehydrogenase